MVRTPMACTVAGNSNTRSRCVTETVNGSHHFTINGYSLAKGMGVGKYIASESFSVGGYQWAIYFYPDGKNAEDNSLYVSVFIALASEGTDVRALFELTLLDQSGKGKHKVHSHFDRSLESGPYTLKYRGSMWGYKRFFRRAVMETSDFLKNDSLAITCTVGVVVSSTQGPRLYSIPVPEPDLGQHFGALLDSGEGADVTFEVDGEVYQAHKMVLAARSPVFKAQLFGPMRDRNSGNIEIEDVEPPVFKALLHFIYRDSLPDTKELIRAPSTSILLAQHLLAAADRYGLDRLRLLCESKLCENVSVDTVATTLALAEQHHAAELKAVCLKFAASNLAAVMHSEGFEYLRDSCPTLQSELLKTVAGVYEEGVGTGVISNRNRSVWGQMSDGADAGGRRVRPRT
ncbi:BTB/POZ and MATH domain-containing protein 1 isoform X2 [Physcomitrium patens]|uniref:BTB domain-containing protein n=1 Tax=Physcomitrium patens TaxID=3218 RepID=A0A2K1JNZ9_PHYPA|nr:BTB/POZ and MATH domain-containing protein 1-like isoform X2 [Physcomitrium patens]PNR43275.1 hypothetical protein PHYPA_015655 [Physcomitrium patens]|eukprot:XP_024391130.1 BTB/POZ and MATH domain-containing protein 1-like isoform X2 [Physcomitrella patens]